MSLTNQWPPLTALDQHVLPGERGSVVIPVTRELDGGEVSLCVNILRGMRPGPTMLLLGLQHGDEWFIVKLMKDFIQQVDLSQMAGTLLLIPVSNPIGFGLGWRNTQLESDSPDMNRAWPGTYDWLCDLLAKKIDAEILPLCDAILDFHPGPWGVAFSQIRYGADFTDEVMNQRSRDLALSFGYRYMAEGKVMGAFPGPKSLLGYAGSKRGIPTLNISIGGSGFDEQVEQSWIEQTIIGIHNVMAHLGMLKPHPTHPESVLNFRKVYRVHPSIGGLLIPHRSISSQLEPVTAGEILADIVSPYDFEILQQLVSPCHGWLAYMSRSYPVHPGGWGFGVIDGDSAEWISLK